MKITSITIGLIFISNMAFGQFFSYQHEKILLQNIQTSKKMLMKRCIRDKFSKKIGLSSKLSDNLDMLSFIPISLFYVAKDGIEYDSSKSIIDFLKYRKRQPLFSFFTFLDDDFYGLMDLTDEVSFGARGLKVCSFWTIKGSPYVIEDPLLKGLNYLNLTKREVDFLFNVKYFLNTIWFIEEEKVLVLDLNEMKVYDPNKFIETKCYDGFIKDIASGGSVTCNQ